MTVSTCTIKEYLQFKIVSYTFSEIIVIMVKSNNAYAVTLWHEILWVLVFAIFSAIRKNKFPQIKITAKFFLQKFTPEEILFSLT